jgi:hypothetical protein
VWIVPGDALDIAGEREEVATVEPGEAVVGRSGANTEGRQDQHNRCTK